MENNLSFTVCFLFMVCPECGEKEIVYYSKKLDGPTRCCPKYNQVCILSKELSLEIYEKTSEYFRGMFFNYLDNFDKKSLIRWLFAYREKLSGDFILTNPYMKLSDFLTINALIIEVMNFVEHYGTLEANEKNTKEIIYFFSIFTELQYEKSLIKEDFGYLISSKNDYLSFVKSKCISPSEVFKTFTFVNDESWVSVIDSFDQSFIMTNSSAERYLKENESAYLQNKITMSSSRKRNSQTPQEIISAPYPFFQSFRTALTKNYLFAEIFNFDYFTYKKVLIDLLPMLVSSFGFQRGLLTVTNIYEFKQFLKYKFRKLDQDTLYHDLVFSHTNRNIFPFFLEIDGLIYISVFFSHIIRLFYYPFYYESFFKKENDKLSRAFEQDVVPNSLADSGFKVKTDLKKKNSFQIDAISWKHNILYVIEVKIWDIKPYFEHKRIHDYRKRDLEGVVDGKKYTFKKGILKAKDIPSLKTKIQFVENNIQKLCPDYKAIDRIEGLIITKSYPPINTYNGVKIISYCEIKNL